MVLGTGKLAGLDKKLSRNLDQEVQMGSSPLELSKSPVGPLAESSRCACPSQAGICLLRSSKNLLTCTRNALSRLADPTNAEAV